VLALVAIAVTATLLGLRGSGAQRGSPPLSQGTGTAAPTAQASPASSATPSGGPSATASEANPTAAPPAGGTGPLPPAPSGWRLYRDPTGFQCFVPAGWSQSQDGTIVYFRDAGTGRVLGIDQTNQPKPDPVADWRAQAAYRVARGDFPGYQQVKIVAVSYWIKAADWEFTYQGRGGRVHVINRGFIVSEHKAHGIWWQTPDAQWATNLPNLRLVFDSFRPAG
jgi:hypothetical protein